MVANLNDTYIIADMNKYDRDPISIEYVDDTGMNMIVYYYCFPCYPSGDTLDLSFVAIQFGLVEQFQRFFCKEVRETRNPWDGDYKTKHEFNVTNQFEYGQNNEKTFRFLVFQDQEYCPSQRYISQSAKDSYGVTYLRGLINIHSDLASQLPFGEDILGAIDSIADGDLHSF